MISIFEQAHKNGVELAEDALKNHQKCLEEKNKFILIDAFDLKEALICGFDFINSSFPPFPKPKDLERYWLEIYIQFKFFDNNEY